MTDRFLDRRKTTDKTDRTYFVTVFHNLKAPGAKLLATVLRVNADASIDWVKQHADEIAARAADQLPRHLGAPCALWVGEADPMLAA